MSFLDQILARKRVELEAAKQARSLDDLKRMIRDAPPQRSLCSALGKEFGYIAEIKRCSPSGGAMPAENVERAPEVYGKSSAVKAVSVLTNHADFGMGIEELTRVRALVPQPILRKDFIFEPYQIYEARAFGADALLLMANVLRKEQMQQLFGLAGELGLDVLFEAHTVEEIESIPAGAKLYGINSRKFKASKRWMLTRSLIRLGLAGSGGSSDLSVDLGTFSLVKNLPKDVIKIAESGVKPSQVKEIMELGYNAILVGTSLLKASKGIEGMLREFEKAIASDGAVGIQRKA